MSKLRGRKGRSGSPTLRRRRKRNYHRYFRSGAKIRLVKTVGPIFVSECVIDRLVRERGGDG